MLWPKGIRSFCHSISSILGQNLSISGGLYSRADPHKQNEILIGLILICAHCIIDLTPKSFGGYLCLFDSHSIYYKQTVVWNQKVSCF